MGEYYTFVNMDKKEYIDPVNFGYGAKLHESAWTRDRTFRRNEFLGALYALLSTDWKGDTLIFLGDEACSSEKDVSPFLRKLLARYKLLENKGVPYDCGIDGDYRDVSGLFKAAEEVVREDIQSMIDYIDFSANYYKVNPNAPFDGLFVRESVFFRYTINHTKKEFFDMGENYANGCTEHPKSMPEFNPLPFLEAFGRMAVNRYDGCW